MKRLIFILLTICICFGVQGQNNHIIGTFQPQDSGVGLRYDRIFNGVGLYTSLSVGNYKLNYIDRHYKTALGLMFQIKDYSFLTVGVNYHAYGVTGVERIINPEVFNPISLELGATCRIERFIAGFRMDVLKWEGCVEFGVAF